MNAILSRTAAIAVAGLLAGCVVQPENLSMQGPSGSSESITFPNGTVFGGASSKEASSLAKIAVDANNNNMKEFAAIQAADAQQAQAAQQAARQAEQERAAIKALGSNELKTSQQAVSMLEQLSAVQGTGQITLFFPTGATRIPQGSLQYDRLVNFLDYLSRQSRGRTVLFVMIGSASATGSHDINERLSRERSEAPAPIIDQYLVNVPHQYYKIAGIGDSYAPKDASLSVEQRYQNVRIIAVYQTDQVPRLPGSTTR
jgi:outer membrane protein OmpA-like peptidoglycan-associated protein